MGSSTSVHGDPVPCDDCSNGPYLVYHLNGPCPYRDASRVANYERAIDKIAELEMELTTTVEYSEAAKADLREEISALEADKRRLKLLYQFGSREGYYGVTLQQEGQWYVMRTRGGTLIGEGLTFEEAIDDSAMREEKPTVESNLCTCGPTRPGYSVCPDCGKLVFGVVEEKA